MMAISDDFIRAVKTKDVIGIRLMLKNSLILDPSFEQYQEMIQYVEKSGVDIWMSFSQIERKEKPWSVDLMNYELTAIMDDYSKEHMMYLHEIVKYVYGGSEKKTGDRYKSEKRSAEDRDKQKKDILERTHNIVTILKDARNNNKTKKDKLSYDDVFYIDWSDQVLKKIKLEASAIINNCDDLQKGR